MAILLDAPCVLLFLWRVLLPQVPALCDDHDYDGDYYDDYVDGAGNLGSQGAH